MSEQEAPENQAGRKRTAVLRCVADIEPLSEQAQEAAESAYRRSYCQGFAAAIYAMEDGKSLGELDEFMYGDLAKWRARRKGGFVPPTP